MVNRFEHHLKNSHNPLSKTFYGLEEDWRSWQEKIRKVLPWVAFGAELAEIAWLDDGVHLESISGTM
jgi:hypothetical protein